MTLLRSRALSVAAYVAVGLLADQRGARIAAFGGQSDFRFCLATQQLVPTCVHNRSREQRRIGEAKFVTA